MVLLLAFFAGCNSAPENRAEGLFGAYDDVELAAAPEDEDAAFDALDAEPMLMMEEAGAGGLSLRGKLSPSAPPPPMNPAPDRSPRRERQRTATRSWFPEAFLWRPLVETGDDGVAEVEVRVPDQLSTFRVLALAHDRRGQQAGDVHQFATRLPVYVDPVVPDRLYRGDRIALPVQVVNGSQDAIEATLTVEAAGSLEGAGSAEIELSAGGSDVRRIELVAQRPGAGSVRAEVVADEHSDAAERTVVVLPSGRPVVQTVARRLSADPFTLAPARGADAKSERIEVTVFGGPWSVLQAEVERIANGARPVDPAYGFALSRHVAALAAATGVELDADRQRLLRVHAWQRLARLARAPTPGQAADLLASLRGVEGDELVDALVPELVRQTEQGQTQNGTWSRERESTLQQVLVQTAVAARVLPEDHRGPKVRAAGAIERSLSNIDDPYTASVVLAAGLVPADDRERLQGMIREAVEEGRVVVPETVRNPRGEPPSPTEALAWAILALGETDDVASSLIAELLGAWRADRGFGAGAADTVALEAIVRALPPPDAPLELELRQGDQVVSTATLDPAQPRVPARFTVEPGAEPATLSVHADPPAPGLVMVASRRSWVGWRSTDRVPGVDVDIEVDRLSVGRRGRVRFEIAAPSRSQITIRQALPPGVTVPSAPPSSRATIEVFPDEIVLTTAAFQPGEVIDVDVPVVASFAGRFSTAPLVVSVDEGPAADLRPETWVVRE